MDLLKQKKNQLTLFSMLHQRYQTMDILEMYYDKYTPYFLKDSKK